MDSQTELGNAHLLGIWLVVTGVTPFVNITAVSMVHVLRPCSPSWPAWQFC